MAKHDEQKERSAKTEGKPIAAAQTTVDIRLDRGTNLGDLGDPGDPGDRGGPETRTLKLIS